MLSRSESGDGLHLMFARESMGRFSRAQSPERHAEYRMFQGWNRLGREEAVAAAQDLGGPVRVGKAGGEGGDG